MMARWRAPTIVCARTELGTIKHSLLTIEALRARGVPVLGIAFIGEAHDENERIITKLEGVSSLGRVQGRETVEMALRGGAIEDHIDVSTSIGWLVRGRQP